MSSNNSLATVSLCDWWSGSESGATVPDTVHNGNTCRQSLDFCPARCTKSVRVTNPEYHDLDQHQQQEE